MERDHAPFPFSACILAGGRGSRMGGVNKALLPFGDATMLQSIVTALSPLFGEVFLAARDTAPFSGMGLRVALDGSELVGSLTGVLTALENTRSDRVFVRACDAPLLVPALVADLLDRCSDRWDVVVPQHDHGYVEPLCAVYSTSCLPHVQDQLERGDMRIRDFYDKVRVLKVPVAKLRRWDPGLLSFANANTPEELEQLRKKAFEAGEAGAAAPRRPSRSEAVARLLARCPEPNTLQTTPREAVGRVCAHEVHTAQNMPDTPRSALDGYALCAQETEPASAGTPVRLAVGEAIRPSQADPPPLAPGTAVRILTGGRLPLGADTVLPQEHARIEQGTLVVHQAMGKGKGVRPAGADFSSGMPVAGRGRVLSAPACATLELDGQEQVEIFARPRCRVLAVGNELAGPGSVPQPGQQPADNLTLACSMVCGFGAVVEDCSVCPNEPATITRMLAAPGADLIVTAGGTGPGDRDFLRRSAGEAGFSFLLHNVALHPGKSAFAAVRGTTLLLGLPGTSSALLRLLPALVLPVLRALGGHAQPWQVTTPVRMGWDARAPGDAERLEFCRLEYEGAGRIAHLVRDGEHRIRAEMIGADALVRVPPGGLRRGDVAQAYSISSPTPPSHSPPGRALP